MCKSLKYGAPGPTDRLTYTFNIKDLDGCDLEINVLQPGSLPGIDDFKPSQNDAITFKVVDVCF